MLRKCYKNVTLLIASRRCIVLPTVVGIGTTAVDESSKKSTRYNTK